MIFEKKFLRLYAVTDSRPATEESFYKNIEAALTGGATMLQLREKGLSEDALIQKALRVKELCRRRHVPLIINDNAEAAIKSGADGVHVGIHDASVADIRKRAGKGFLIGATAKTVKQAQAAESDGADYLGVGALFPSPTKKDAIRITPGQLREICASVSIPVVAIGGISQENALELKGCGIEGIAVVSAIFLADDIQASARELRSLAEAVTGHGDANGAAQPQKEVSL